MSLFSEAASGVVGGTGGLIGDAAAEIAGDPTVGVEVDESAFDYEGTSAQSYQNDAAAASTTPAPQMTAADVAAAQIAAVPGAQNTIVGAVDPITGVAIGPVDPAVAAAAQDELFRQAQTELVGGLQATVAGGGPSVAELQLRAGQDEALRQAMAAGATAPGGVNPALVQRMIQQQGAEGARVTNQEAAILRAQEQATARGELGDVVGAGRTQDISASDVAQDVTIANLSASTELAIAQGTIDLETAVQNQQIVADLVAQQANLDATTAIENLTNARELAISQGNIDLAVNLEQARLDQEASVVNLESELEQQRINQELVIFYESLGFETNMAQFQADQDLQRLLVDQDIGIESLNTAEQNAAVGAGADVVGGIIGGAGAAIGLSDARLKTDIESVGESAIGAALLAMGADDDSIESFLDELEPFSFRYKDPDQPGATDGEIIGVMAQDVEKSAAGEKVVVETPTGKGLDVVKALSLALASSANLNARVRSLEE